MICNEFVSVKLGIVPFAKQADSLIAICLFAYSEPGSNRHRFPYRCLRPTRLPIPPSELKTGAKVRKKVHSS